MVRHATKFPTTKIVAILMAKWEKISQCSLWYFMWMWNVDEMLMENTWYYARKICSMHILPPHHLSNHAKKKSGKKQTKQTNIEYE